MKSGSYEAYSALSISFEAFNFGSRIRNSGGTILAEDGNEQCLSFYNRENNAVPVSDQAEPEISISIRTIPILIFYQPLKGFPGGLAGSAARGCSRGASGGRKFKF